MAMFLRVACFWLCFARQIMLHPAIQPNVNPHMHLSKRWEAGPELGGVNFPDPSIILVNGVWYSFATRTIGSSIHIQIAQSGDFASWSLVNNEDGSQRDALPDLPPWVNSAAPNTWAPDVQQLTDGSFVMYYSASVTQYPHLHCVGAATSNTILGPYSAQEDPLICPLSQGGAIDAAGFHDGSQRYIVYKVDGNSLGYGGLCGNTNPPIVSTPIILQPVGLDGVTLQENSTILLDNEGYTDEGCVEAPSLVQIGNQFILFFSSGCFLTLNYTVNYATAPSITGPYERAAAPLFVTFDYGLVGPGGMSIYYQDGKHMLFHAWTGSTRALYTAVVSVIVD